MKKNEVPEWEIKLREKLERELPEGNYSIGTDTFRAMTGKGGYINYRIALKKEIIRYINESS